MNGAARQRGLTLAEVLVSMAIMLVAAQASFLLYGAAWDAFKKGESAAVQQQSARIAFDKLGLDLQMAGYNYNPDGDPVRPDEQIEAAFDTAIVVRADFDGQDATLSSNPESSLAEADEYFDVVSTGNSEIVAYVLAKPNGSSTDTLTFEADVKDHPRDGVNETVNIPNVALTFDDPPYSLYRVRLCNDEGNWGTSDFFHREVLAENVGSLTFRYFDAQGNQLNPTFALGSFADDIGGAEAAAGTRASIYRVEIGLVTLTHEPDRNWSDPNDSNPTTKSFRKFRLRGEIMPRNLGKTGVADLPTF